MDISRRSFVANSLGLAGLRAMGGTVVGDELATAAHLADRHFIFCYFPGAWDVLLTLDPRDPDVFRDDRTRQTRIEPGYHLLPAQHREPVQDARGVLWGPYIGEFASIASRATVVRGLSMDTLTHEVGRRRFITGRVPNGQQARGASLATVLASQLGADRPIPNLVSHHEAHGVSTRPHASAVTANTTSELVQALLHARGTHTGAQRRHLQGMLDRFRAHTPGAVSPRLAAALGLGPSASTSPAELTAAFDFSANTPAMRALRETYGMSSGDISSPEARAAMAVTAITHEVSRCVSISVCESLDTHDDDWRHAQGPRQQRGLNLIARMVHDLASRPYRNTNETWLDRTVIVGFSDFSRTPLLNRRGGRDHWLGNSCILVGAGIKKGAIIGASSDVGMAPQRVDLATGALDAEGTLLKPEHILRALCVDMGLHDDRVTELGAPPLMAALEA